MIVAHKTKDGRLQSLEEHAQGTAQRASDFAGAFGCAHLGEAAGLLHDAGKCSPGFQRRILHNGPKVEHAAAGAKLCMDAGNLEGLALAFCIGGHHSGLPDRGDKTDTLDMGTLTAKIKRQDKEQYDLEPALVGRNIKQLLSGPKPPMRWIDKGGYSLALYIRMLYSCLVDADYLDTERFMQESGGRQPLGQGLPCLLDKLEQHLSQFDNPTHELNRRRNDILQRCREAGAWKKGLYTLTVPTGGGKTLSSLAFALTHGVKHKMSRVVYAIPYISITEQNAQVFRKVLGDDNVLECHSSVAYDDQGEDMASHRLATENFEAPVVVTTNVQLFESLHSNRSSQCRKLHNLANAVIILDEAQMLPLPFLLPCVRAIAELVHNYGCTVLLMSATQPALEGLFPADFEPQEICPNRAENHAAFRRAQLVQLGDMTQGELTERLCQLEQGLCIVNTRKQAQALYALLPTEGRFHLSTLMCPVHRRQVLDTVRKRLKAGQACRVVSTSLIEAGVDVDFPAVYRQEAGLDAQIQAAGRCNREGKRLLSESITYIFRLTDSLGQTPASMKQLISAANLVTVNHADPSAPEAIHAYFTKLYEARGEKLDNLGIVNILEGAARGCIIPFESIAKVFKLIENQTHSVLIPLDEQGKGVADKLRAGLRNQTLMRQAGQYQVSVYDSDFRSLFGYLEVLDEQLSILTEDKLYDEHTGLKVPETGCGIMC